MPHAEILSQGDELVTGQTIDTNAAWLAEQLTERGVQVLRHGTVGDRLEHIVEALSTAVSRARIVICTGGLGPTDDDLTAEACARAFDRPLELDAEALAAIEARYRLAGREMPASNRKQAMLPRGSIRLPNALGTAPGFAFEAGGAFVACLPGVPHEMEAMFRDEVLPRLERRFTLVPGRLVVLRTVGLGESALQDRIGSFRHPSAELGTRALLGEVDVKLRFPPRTPPETIEAAVRELTDRIGPAVYAIDGLHGPVGRLADVVGEALVARGETLALAESCTGGQLAARCTAVPGASRWFLEACVTYANEAKMHRLGVSEALLAEHGAVSEPVARAMAEGIRVGAGATYGIGVTGIAGPGGGTPLKPVGTVHVALATPEGTQHRLLRLSGDRARIQAHAVQAALDLLRRHLLPAPATPTVERTP